MINYIYAISDSQLNVVYVGMSQVSDLERPYQHKDSHNDELKYWHVSLGYEPIVHILERDVLDIRKAESKWIYHFKSLGHKLFNKTENVRTFNLSNSDEVVSLGSYVKSRRRLAKITQAQLAQRLAIALTVVRKIEQGKTNFVFAGLIEVTKAFGLDVYVSKKDK